MHPLILQSQTHSIKIPVLVNYPSKNVLTYMINLTTLPWGEKYEGCSDKFLPSDRQFPNTLARGSKDGVGDCRWGRR